MKTLDIIEVGKKQKYIFQSNRLNEIVGASMIIREISESLPRELFKQRADTVGHPKPVVEGGGHSLYLFETKEQAKRFNQHLSKRVITNYPGVELNCCLLEFDEKQALISDAIDEIFKHLAKKKGNGPAFLHQFSFGIERLCESSQLPAGDKDLVIPEERRAVAPEIKIKVEFVKNHRPNEYFSNLIHTPYQLYNISVQMDELSDDRNNKVALIHIDGNGMGKKVNRFKKLNAREAGESVEDYNERYRQEFHQFSKDIDDAYKRAFNNMLVRIEKAVRSSDKDSPLDPFKKEIIIRPLIFAGDDISFIFPGSLGVEAARIMIEEVKKESLVIHGSGQKEEKIAMHACAGVAIVKSCYPFSMAHELAEQLCGHAKARLANDLSLKKEKIEGDDASLLDFHVLNGTWDRSLGALRKKNYEINVNGRTALLTMKPFYIMDKYQRNRSQVLDFSVFQESMRRIMDRKIARSKIKRLREHILSGPSAASRYVQLTDLGDQLTKNFPPLSLNELFTSTAEHTCLYFDAIEAMDDVILVEDGE